MSQRYPGGVITKSPTAPTQTAATGVWTLEQVAENVKNSTWPPNGPYFVEDVFSTYLYTGTGSQQTINNGIDLSGKGGLVWYKSRSSGAWNHYLIDSARGQTKFLVTNSTAAQDDFGDGSFNSTGFVTPSSTAVTQSTTTYATWTFRKQPKFFDVVTYTGNGTAGRTVAHNLGSVPGCMIVKRTDAADGWPVYHRSIGATTTILLNGTGAQQGANSAWWNNTTPTSTVFTVGNDDSVNGNGATYVAYLFAHDAGGFGTSGNDSIISCGSFSTNSGEASTTELGWEPQWLLIKKTSAAQDWYLADNMRGLNVVGQDDYFLYPNLASAEGNNNRIGLTATGFTTSAFGASSDFIYIAIRRGPMKTPTDGTKVFAPAVRTGTNGTTSYTGLSFSPDLVIGKARANTYSPAPTWTTKLIGTLAQLGSSSSNGETAATDAITGWINTGYNLGADNSLGNYNLSTTSNNYVTWNFGRAPGFFDVVCYTGTGSARTVSHNLGVAPELIIAKKRDAAGDSWAVYAAPLTSSYYLLLNSTQAATSNTSRWTSTAPSSTVFRVGTDGDTNDGGAKYVAYLFASVTGVSKVGSYTGTGTTLQINCGFTSGARFVMIKRTDDAYPWYVWDSARGIVDGNDPYIRINQISAEVTDQDDIDPYSSGFQLSTAALGINASGGSYIYLAIA